MKNKVHIIMVYGWGLDKSIFKYIKNYFNTSMVCSFISPYNYEELKNKIQYLIKQNTHILLIGHSLGGLQILNVLSSFNIKAYDNLKVLLINSFSQFYKNDVVISGIDKKIIKLMKKNLVRNKDKVIESFLSTNNLSPYLSTGYVCKSSIEELSYGLDVLMNVSKLDFMQHNTYINILSLSGSNDTLVSKKMQNEVLVNIKNIVFEDSGHILLLSDSEKVIDIIKSFM